MLSFIKEKETLWQYLKTVDKPIVLYGTGDGATKILWRLERENIMVSDIFVSDEFYRGQIFRGFAVRKYSELEILSEPVVVLIAFASEQTVLLERFFALAQRQETYAPHVPLFPEEEVVTPVWLAKNETAIRTVYERLADNFSRKVFADVLNYKLSGKLCYLKECTTKREDDLKALFRFDFPGVYVDAGAYDGDTIKEFVGLSKGRYKKIYAIEPDSKNFLRLRSTIERDKLVDVVTVEAGIWHSKTKKVLFGNGGRQSFLDAKQLLGCGDNGLRKERSSAGNFSSETEGKTMSRIKKIKRQIVSLETIDNLLQDEEADYIKFDVEGAEKEALLGATKHLVKGISGRLPQLLIAAYHHDRDLIDLPLLLWEMRPDYQIYLRKHPYIPAWEINFFACGPRDENNPSRT